MREYPQLRGLPPLEALAKYLSGPAVAHHSVCLQLAQHAPAAIQFFALRDAFGIGGYMTEEQAIAAIKSTLGVQPTGVTLNAEDTHFLAVRLRRLCAHLNYTLPQFASDDAALVIIAGTVIGALLTNMTHGVQPARTRKATDAEVLEWAKRHDLDCWDDLTVARQAFEDAETHHLTRTDGVREDGNG